MTIVSFMADTEYITSERFIWDHLTRAAERGMIGLNTTWRRDRCISPFAVSWPAEAVKDHNGVIVDGPVTQHLGEPEQWSKQLVELIKLTNSYAILRAIQREDHIEVILESHHGTRHWTLAIMRSGDVDVLGKPQRQSDNQKGIGLLYRQSSEAS